MSTGLRRIVVAGVALLVLAAVLAVRLNATRISQHFYAQISQATDVKLSADQSSLTLMHGVGLRLEHVSLHHRQFQMQAGHIIVSLRLLPLLLGKIQVNTLDIHDATIIIQPDALQPTSAAISSLPVQRISLVRSQVLTPDGEELLNNLHLDLRNIGMDSETLWELNAKQDGQSISGNGRLFFHTGNITRGFGKLKLTHFPLLRLQSLVPATLMTWLLEEGKLLDGALTLDITKAQTWSLFGEARVESGKAVSAISLRGRLNHTESGSLSWRDSFVHFGKQGVVAITGTCQQNHCSTTLEAEHMPMSKWAHLLPRKLTLAHMIKANTQLKAVIQWHKTIWHAHADVNLSDASFHAGETDYPLPDLHLKVSKLAGDTKGWHAETAVEADGGIIHMQSSQRSNGDFDMAINTQSADAGLWLPLSNMLFATLHIKPALQADGVISGKLRLHQHGDIRVVNTDVNGDAAQLSYPGWLVKPNTVKAHGQATIKWQGEHTVAATLQAWQLGDATLGNLDWKVKKKDVKKQAVKKTTRQSLSIKHLNVDFDQLHSQGVQLPESLPAWHGALRGGGKTSWSQQTEIERQSTENEQQPAANTQTHTMSDMAANLTGKWQLDGFGIDDWHIHADVGVRQGRFTSEHLLLDGVYGKATLRGSYQAASGHGNIDVISGNLNRDTVNAIPSFWQQLSLQGQILHGELQFLGNRWQDIQSRYQLTKGVLMLRNFSATLAGGSFTSKKLALTALPEGLGIGGDIRAKHVQLSQLTGLGDWLQADIGGKLQANIILHGVIAQGAVAQTSMHDWQRSNGDMLIYDGSWRQRIQAEATPASATDSTAQPLPPYTFSKLEFRFRTGGEKTAISAIKLISHQQQYRGKASVDTKFRLHGELQNHADHSHYRLDSVLPRISWITLPNKP